MKKIGLLIPFVFLLATEVSKAQEKRGLKLGEKIGKLTAKLMTSKTSNLGEAAVLVHHINGMHTMEARISGQEVYPEDFREGDVAVAIFFSKAEGLGMLNIDGSVTSEGKELTSTGLGYYMIELEPGDLSPKTVNVETVTGDKASFTIKPVPSVKILSVNGSTSNAQIDLSKDIELVLENGSGHERSLLNVALVTDVAGARGFNYFASFKSTDKVIIPKEAFSNPTISGSVNGVGNYNQGENYLIVERYVQAPTDKQSTAAAELQSRAYGSMKVNVSGKQQESVYGSTSVKGKIDNPAGVLNFAASKPNAATGAPFSQGSKFAVSSLSVRGVLFKQEVDESVSYGYNTKITTTTTTTYQFPKLPDAFWDQLLSNMYADIVTMFREEFDIEMVPTEKLTASSYYKEFYPVKEKNTDELIVKTYKNTVNMQPTKVADIFGSISTNLTSDRPIINLMKDADVDGLINVQMDLQIAGDDNGKIILVPRLNFFIQGREETYTNKDVQYGSGWVAASDGKPFSESEFNDINALNSIVRKDDMMNALKDAMTRLREAEIERGYDKIWALK
ncbi:hypothetical protein RT717_25595 [Imperialibacter roseus]|uniref:Uncharacterized protein n=1 Tax=Imperialibacter roseus TaxID=1324217 RepID=A0ABZ0IN38_9BACT|nr:hypothetical protein [Imperialibacter roseus]WOK06453.1 hypothetical protein RT717_25595 [Imperialibacter roseus]